MEGAHCFNGNKGPEKSLWPMALQYLETSPASMDRCSMREQSNKMTNRLEGTEVRVTDELPQSLRWPCVGIHVAPT